MTREQRAQQLFNRLESLLYEVCGPKTIVIAPIRGEIVYGKKLAVRINGTRCVAHLTETTVREQAHHHPIARFHVSANFRNEKYLVLVIDTGDTDREVYIIPTKNVRELLCGASRTGTLAPMLFVPHPFRDDSRFAPFRRATNLL